MNWLLSSLKPSRKIFVLKPPSTAFIYLFRHIFCYSLAAQRPSEVFTPYPQFGVLPRDRAAS